VTVVNTSGRSIPGPVFLVLDGLSKKDKARLRNASGRTAAGSPYLRLDPGQLSVGSRVTFVLRFKGAAPHYKPRVLAGFGVV
jgi:hypothetical protein